MCAPTNTMKTLYKDLKDQRNEAISRLMDNSGASGCDPELAAIAERDGVTYTTANEIAIGRQLH